MLYDINKVCNMLGTTSRALRFYEEKGIIESTKEGLSSRRKYTEAQVSEIHNVLVLRTLGLSVKAIKELRKENSDLRNAVLTRRAEIISWISEKSREIELLNEALAVIDSGEDIFNRKAAETSPEGNALLIEIANICTKAICDKDYKNAECYFSKTLSDYMPESAFSAMMKDTLAPVGNFVAIETITTDPNHANIIYSFVRYEKMGLKFKFVFHNKKIDGLWTSYYRI
ncbi:MAG: MerR family transcriptional regulator [Clostridia bacterium]|nr:MerR family transcriptional regulator [Clostridia bacterium]